MIIVPLAEIALAHRAFHVAAAESGHVVAVSYEGIGSLISPDLNQTAPFQVSPDSSSITIAPDGTLLAVTGRGGLTIISASTLKPVHRIDDSFESVHFSSNGMLWSSIRLDSRTVALEIMDTQTWSTIARTEVPDPFGDSFFGLRPHPQPDCAVIWAAAGQDGQSLFWAHRNGAELVVDQFPELNETAWPGFSPTGKEFLVICANSAELRRYAFPSGPLIARMQWPFEDEDDQIGDFVSYAGDSHAVVSSNEGRLFLIDLERMAIADEIVVGANGLPPDLAFFLPLPTGRFLSVHRDFSSVGSADRHDGLAAWRLTGEH